MRIFTSRENVLDRLVGTRLCLLLVLVFACFMDRFNPSDAAPTNVMNGASSIVRRSISNLTDVQRNLVVTIEVKNIDQNNNTAVFGVKIVYEEVRMKILEYLNGKKQAITLPTYSTEMASDTSVVATIFDIHAVDTTNVLTTHNPPTTTITLASTAVMTSTAPNTTSYTAQTATSVAQTTNLTMPLVEATVITPPPIDRGTPSPFQKRRRRNIEGNNHTYTDEDIDFVYNGPEFDENGNLIITILIDKEGDDHDLYEILKILNETGKLKHIGDVERIYRGLPTSKAMADLKVWLPILLVIFILLIVIVFVCCWKATHKKMKDEERKKIIPKLDSKRASSNGHAAGPRILDDNCGWIIPYDQFTNEK